MINNFKVQSNDAFLFLKGLMLIINIIFISILLILFQPGLINASVDLEKETEKKSILKTKTTKQTENKLHMDIIVDPRGQAINAVGAYLEFPSGLVQASSISTDKSFCDLFIIEEYNNSKGLVTVLCGKPNPGISTSSIVAQLEFEKISEGDAVFIFNEQSSVHANDGFGSDVLLKSITATSTIH